YAIVGSSNTVTLLYSGITGPTNFGSQSFSVGFASSETGAEVGIVGDGGSPNPAGPGLILLPNGYISGSELGVSTATFANTTLADLGLTAGTSFAYLFPAQGGESLDTFTVNVGVSPVPLPASAPMFGAALLALGAVGYGMKRKKAAAAA
ncbi:hypothetical protein P7D22_19995, partial [Lichenihabitans sp. Uapishka_5]|uniref:hypothetical protein n=1 Tax=Lichenihabitans sp. Uapishka_5 TaxID=3037302 RepID=UPI0029E7D5BC